MAEGDEVIGGSVNTSGALTVRVDRVGEDRRDLSSDWRSRSRARDLLVRATYATLGVLVVGYPCALGMATPLTMIRGGGTPPSAAS